MKHLYNQLPFITFSDRFSLPSTIGLIPNPLLYLHGNSSLWYRCLFSTFFRWDLGKIRLRITKINMTIFMDVRHKYYIFQDQRYRRSAYH
jgi:hypothetical protein